MLITDIPSTASYTYTGIRTFPVLFSFYGTTTILAGFRASSDPTNTTPYVPLIFEVDYTVTGTLSTDNDSGQAYKNGSMTLTDAGAAKLTNGNTVVITRSTPIEQQFAYSELDNFPAKSHENGLSRLAVICQELKDTSSRALMVPPGSSGSGEEVLKDIYDIANKAEQSVIDAEKARDGAAEARDIAVEAAAVVNPENFVAVKNHDWAFEALKLPQYETKDALRVPRVNYDGSELELVDIANAVTVAGVQSRNTVIRGRVKNGYPAYLVGPEFISTPHENAIYNSKMGTVLASGEYSSNYLATGPLRNQVVAVNGGWLSPKTVPNGWWQYDFADGEHIIAGMYYQCYPHAAGCSIGKWKLLGWNEATGAWETIYERLQDQELKGTVANSNKAWGRMYWFTDNTKAYKSIRIQIDANTGYFDYVSIETLRFYEAVVPGMHKYDVALYASEKEPFSATIACGLAMRSNSKTSDREVHLTSPVIFDGSMFEEMSRNYMYIVAAELDGSLPAMLNPAKAIKLPGNDSYLYTDTRRIHYGTEQDIANTCFCLLQSRYTTNQSGIDKYFEHSQGAFPHPLDFRRMSIHTTEKPRGAKSSYHFTGSPTCYISPNRAQTNDGFPTNHGHPYCEEQTVELDFKWQGPAPESSSTYSIVFDNGQAGDSRSWAIAYQHRERCFVVYAESKWLVCAPFNAADNKWHTLSISLRPGFIYIHVDGKCIGAFDGIPLLRYPSRMYYGIGRWIHSDSASWYGYINNVRVTFSTCKYQGNDYEVTPTFHMGLIPHKTLWYDAAEGIVKEWQADTSNWVQIPMLPIGHVDTDRKEHLCTDQPRGTYHLAPTKWVNAYSASDYYDGNTVPMSVFDLGYGGSHPWASNSTMNDKFLRFDLETPMAFERLMFRGTSWDWRSFPAIFKLLGSNNGTDWTVLIDRSTFISDGFHVAGLTASLGAVHNLNFYKSFKYDNAQAFKYYKFEFPSKASVPILNGYSHTSALALLTFRGAKPEITNISSYVIGDVFTYGPVYAKVNSEIEIAVPFENVAYDAVGFVDAEVNAQVKRRLLGQSGYNYEAGNVLSGEMVFSRRDAMIVFIATSYITPYFGRWDVTSAVDNTTTTIGNIYIVAKKRY